MAVSSTSSWVMWPSVVDDVGGGVVVDDHERGRDGSIYKKSSSGIINVHSKEWD